MTNQQTAAEVAARLVALTNCKETDEIIETFNLFYNNIIGKLGVDNYDLSTVISNGAVKSPRNIPVVKSQEEMKMKLNDYTSGSGGAVTGSMVQSSRPVKKGRPKAHPPKDKGPYEF